MIGLSLEKLIRGHIQIVLPPLLNPVGGGMPPNQDEVTSLRSRMVGSIRPATSTTIQATPSGTHLDPAVFRAVPCPATWVPIEAAKPSPALTTYRPAPIRPVA